MPSTRQSALSALVAMASLSALVAAPATNAPVPSASGARVAAAPAAGAPREPAAAGVRPTVPAGGPVTGDGPGIPGLTRDRHHHRDEAVTVGPVIGDRARPNIVVIMADDMRDDDLRFMPHVRHMIGDRGVRFVNSFSPQPLCCPARASFDSGEYTHNHGVWSHVSPWGFQALDDSETLPVWLNRAGYNTVFLGKYLNGYGKQPLRNGATSVRYIPPGWTDWRASVDGGEERGSPLKGTPEAGGTYSYWDTTLNINGTLRPNQGVYQTRMLGQESERIFDQYSRSPKPFFLWASYIAPHHCMPREPDDPPVMRRSDGKIERIRTPARPARVRGKFDAVIKHAPGYKGEADVCDKPFFIRDLPPITRRERKAVLNATRQRAEALSVLDNQVAAMMHTLKQTGQLDNTYVVFTSDNGYFQGEHRMRQGKIPPYEPSLRVPTLIRGPGIPAGQVRRDPITMIDFAPTFLRIAGAPMEPIWNRGILTETGPRKVHGGTAESDNFLVGTQHRRHLLHRPQGPSPLRFSQGVRTERYLYVEHASREKELYDLHADPGELTNLVHQRRMARVRRALAHELNLLRDCKGSECAQPLPRFLRSP